MRRLRLTGLTRHGRRSCGAGDITPRRVCAHPSADAVRLRGPTVRAAQVAAGASVAGPAGPLRAGVARGGQAAPGVPWRRASPCGHGARSADRCPGRAAGAPGAGLRAGRAAGARRGCDTHRAPPVRPVSRDSLPWIGCTQPRRRVCRGRRRLRPLGLSVFRVPVFLPVFLCSCIPLRIISTSIRADQSRLESIKPDRRGLRDPRDRRDRPNQRDRPNRRGHGDHEIGADRQWSEAIENRTELN